MRAMILAAGRGERMRPLSDTTAKPLLPVADKPLIQYHLESLAAAGIREVVINLAWHGERIKAALGDGAQFGLVIHYSEEVEALETGGGVFQALPLLGAEPFLLISGDVWSEYPLASCIGRLAAADLAHLVLVPNPDFHRQGDFGLIDGRVLDSAAQRYTYGNIGVFHRDFFAGCTPGRFALAPLMFRWARAGRVSGELFEGAWRNLGTPAQLATLDAELRAARIR